MQELSDLYGFKATHKAINKVAAVCVKLPYSKTYSPHMHQKSSLLCTCTVSAGHLSGPGTKDKLMVHAPTAPVPRPYTVSITCSMYTFRNVSMVLA